MHCPFKCLGENIEECPFKQNNIDQNVCSHMQRPFKCLGEKNIEECPFKQNNIDQNVCSAPFPGEAQVCMTSFGREKID